MDAEALRRELAGMDIYLLDHVLKGRFPAGCSILDAGCGSGRNIAWFARNGFEVHAIDADDRAVARVQEWLPQGRATRAELGALPHADASFDAVLCIAVLHFMDDEAHWHAAVNELWRVLKPGGLLFARFGTTISIEQHIETISGRRHRNRDGQVLYLPDLEALQAKQAEWRAIQQEPIKTVNVEHQRTMTNWLLTKPGAPGA